MKSINLRPIQSFLFDILYPFKYGILFFFILYTFIAPLCFMLTEFFSKNIINAVQISNNNNIYELTFYPILFYLLTFLIYLYYIEFMIIRLKKRCILILENQLN
jgi:hypothetical protein